MHDDDPLPPPDPDGPASPRWDDQVPLLLDLALADLRDVGEVLPTMVAFRGDDPLFLATLRPFASGGHQDAVLEVGAIALGLAADRVVLTLSGRAWSMEDPIPPVLPDGPDLRQHVVVVHRADGVGDDPLCLTTVVPVLEGPDGPRAGPALSDVAGQGWVPRALLALVTAPLPLQGRAEELAAQVARCEGLGHRIAWAGPALEAVRQAQLAWAAQHVGGTRRSARSSRSGRRGRRRAA